jgi:hypothetical protein
MSKADPTSWEPNIDDLTKEQAYQKLGLGLKLVIDKMVANSSYRFARRFLVKGMCPISSMHLRNSMDPVSRTQIKSELLKIVELIDLIERVYE